MDDNRRRELLLEEFQRDRMLAHEFLFPQRHKDASPEFHREIIDLLYDPHPLIALMAFRGAAKSTLLEEYVLISMLMRDFVFPLFVGPNWESACERLAPIKYELETNDALIELFGDQVSSPWASDELQLANGARIKAIGAGQSMRGKKHNDERPDLAAIDDLEDEENIRTEDSRRRTERWLTGTLRPALHPTNGKIRFIGTAIHPKALIQKKCEDPAWKSRKFPIINIDLETGEEKSAWPARFPIDWVKNMREDYIKNGNLIEFEQEYMCRAEDIAGKPFQPGMIKVAAAPREFMAVEMFVDPARTVNQRSARTGYAAWAWMGNKLIVLDAQGHFHKPDEIISTIADWENRYGPVHIGVETNGLEEFLMQPLRAEMARRGTSWPILEMRAPQDKVRFIEGLQPFYMAGDVTHAQHLPDLEMELLQFPTGRVDVVNALAYALRMRAGKSVYSDFRIEHIAPALEVSPSALRYLCFSSRPAMTAAALVQYVNGNIRVYHDWVVNAPPQDCVQRITREAILIGNTLKACAPIEQFDRFTNHGLPAAARAAGLDLQRAALAAKTEGKLTPWLQRRTDGEPAFLVAAEARWVTRALARGYARKLEKGGVLSDHPADNQYRLVMEALESFVGWLDSGHINNDNQASRHYARTSDGRTYLTSLPR